MAKKIVYWFDQDGVLYLFEKGVPLELTFKPGFFESRRGDATMIATLKEMRKQGRDVRILTHAYQNGYAVPEKKRSLAREGLGDVPVVFVPYGEDKWEYVDKDCVNVLVDDYTYNLRRWKGIPFKYYNGINGTKGTWGGFSVSCKMNPNDIATQIIGTVERSVYEDQKYAVV